MAGHDRTISVLKLFTIDRPVWTAEKVAEALEVSVSSAYRYVAILVEAGLLTPARGGSYVLGPAIIQYDRQIQLTDPLLVAARPVMADILRYAPSHSVILLSRMFEDTVLCIDQLVDGTYPTAEVSYARGRPMPLFRGATSKIMLPYLPTRDLRRLHAAHAGEIRDAGLGEGWDEFRKALTEMRRRGYVITYWEIDPERIGIAAPLLEDQKRLLGSLSYVIPKSEQDTAPRLGPLLMAAAREVEVRLAED
ncbi:helix-turn-helix domain-containing protein [Roseomonas sp. NAR14]|uniref:Helix-turn-helix domain-containing protein n=1 Tax=Roseomonas acroporae TaxID=2937791 RepID=A0A9X1YCT7_9PROT|nr:IclR family transcriptional regulator C-terminal domain-containing protein [Roseomonas acroporae]MCK8787390.1 helix-turn-helix domain-containing protein [Roseomonas acroporae]